jgi:hypothetical protein
MFRPIQIPPYKAATDERKHTITNVHGSIIGICLDLDDIGCFPNVLDRCGGPLLVCFLFIIVNVLLLLLLLRLLLIRAGGFEKRTVEDRMESILDAFHTYRVDLSCLGDNSVLDRILQYGTFCIRIFVSQKLVKSAFHA